MSDLVKTLFRNPSELPAPLTDKQLEEKRRYESGITFWLDNPAAGDHALRDHLIQIFDISRSQAYRDIAVIKKLIGNYPNAGKEWFRHVVISMLMRAADMAERKGIEEHVIAAADKIGKYTRLDKIDPEQPMWEKMIPPSFEPVPDVTILNINNPSDIEARKAKLMRQYLAEANNITDIEIIE